MAETDRQYNGVMYNTINQIGERGIGEDELRNALPPSPHLSLSPSPYHGHLTFSDHIQCLLNFEMV